MIWINFRHSRPQPFTRHPASHISISTYVLFRTDNSGFPTPDSAPFLAQAKPRRTKCIGGWHTRPHPSIMGGASRTRFDRGSSTRLSHSKQLVVDCSFRAIKLIDANPAVARLIRDMTMKTLAAAQGRLALLGRMTACERVVSFLLELSERNDDEKHVELVMGRCDIADYLGLTVETVCRVLSDLKRRGVIEVSPQSITLLDRFTLEAISEE